ncbi:MAG: hypothetical protein ABWX94_01820 [Candidatus Saccharimonadales bacterium]
MTLYRTREVVHAEALQFQDPEQYAVNQLLMEAALPILHELHDAGSAVTASTPGSGLTADVAPYYMNGADKMGAYNARHGVWRLKGYDNETNGPVFDGRVEHIPGSVFKVFVNDEEHPKGRSATMAEHTNAAMLLGVLTEAAATQTEQAANAPGQRRRNLRGHVGSLLDKIIGF